MDYMSTAEKVFNTYNDQTSYCVPYCKRNASLFFIVLIIIVLRCNYNISRISDTDLVGLFSTWRIILLWTYYFLKTVPMFNMHKEAQWYVSLEYFWWIGPNNFKNKCLSGPSSLYTLTVHSLCDIVYSNRLCLWYDIFVECMITQGFVHVPIIVLTKSYSSQSVIAVAIYTGTAICVTWWLTGRSWLYTRNKWIQLL